MSVFQYLGTLMHGRKHLTRLDSVRYDSTDFLFKYAAIKCLNNKKAKLIKSKYNNTNTNILYLSCMNYIVVWCRRKRCCFAKSSPGAEVRATDNIYNMEQIANSSSTSSGQGTTDSPVSMIPSVAATDDRIYYNDSATVTAGLVPTGGNGHAEITPGEGNQNQNRTRTYTDLSPSAPNAAVQYDVLRNAASPQNNPPQHHPASQAHAAKRHDSGLTLVDNTLYETSDLNPNPNPNDDAVYVNAAFHAGSPPTTS